MSVKCRDLFAELADVSPMILRMVLKGEPLGIVARAENVDELWLLRHVYFFSGALEVMMRDNLIRDWTKITPAEFDERVIKLSANDDEPLPQASWSNEPPF